MGQVKRADKGGFALLQFGFLCCAAFDGKLYGFLPHHDGKAVLLTDVQVECFKVLQRLAYGIRKTRDIHLTRFVTAANRNVVHGAFRILKTVEVDAHLAVIQRNERTAVFHD